jgi:hypothetical protein
MENVLLQHSGGNEWISCLGLNPRHLRKQLHPLTRIILKKKLPWAYLATVCEVHTQEREDSEKIRIVFEWWAINTNSSCMHSPNSSKQC